MGRNRSCSRSCSPRRKRYDDPRDRYRSSRSFRDRRSPAPSGLLIRNISLDARPEDLRIPFERFGPVKDVYLPKNYYTGEPRGFCFVKFRNAEDAAEAKQQMNHTIIGGREIAIVFAEENRKTPQEMRTTGRTSGRYGGSHRRRSPPRSPRRRYRSYSRSPSPVRHDSRNRELRDDYDSPHRSKSISWSPSPRDERDYRSNRRSISRSHRDERDYRSNRRSLTPRDNDCSPLVERDNGSGRKSPSPRRNNRSLSRSRSYSPR